MALQSELFPKPQETIVLHDSHHDPAIWIRRLVLWAQPGEVIRDIPLRRGLNVVWSPDPGSSVAQVGQNSSSGHGAGKTLLCRLLRYCLGEATFASEDQRRSIAAQFPSGLVGAEIVIAGVLWAVIRPIGLTRRHTVRRDTTLEELLESKENATGIGPLLDALSPLVHPQDLSGIAPDSREDMAYFGWLFTLAWLTRDQENRFDHILDWRHPRSGSGSPVSNLAGDQVLAGVRTLLGILDDEETRLKADRQRIPSRRQGIERDLSYFRRRIEELRADLLRRVGLDEGDALGGSLDLAKLQTVAAERLTKAEEVASSRPFAAKILTLSRERDEALQNSAVARAELAKSDADLRNANEHMSALQGERIDLKVEEYRSKQGDICQVCFVEIDVALLEGCPVALKQPGSDALADQKANFERRVENCKASITHYAEESTKNKLRLSGLLAAEESLRSKLADLERLANEHRDGNRSQWSDAQRFQKEVVEFGELQERQLKAERDIRALEDRDKELKESQSALRDRHRDVMRRLNQLYVYVSRGLLGSDIDASIDLTGNGLEAKVQVGGQAMESLKAVAFDLTALLMSLEGRAGIPAFLIHDSPREADLGESIYQRFFRFAVSLESTAEEPPFQYIVTTTSEPPEEIQSSKWLVQKLSGSTVNDRLLRCDLG